jgi:hypothetical protein
VALRQALAVTGPRKQLVFEPARYRGQLIEPRGVRPVLHLSMLSSAGRIAG